MLDKKDFVIKIIGDSGDGVQLIGERLTISAAFAGYDVRNMPDFPAEIRAPAGTIAGVSGFQLAISEKVLFTAGEEADVLVALNPAALKSGLPYLRHKGILSCNSDSFTVKDWEKAHIDQRWFNQQADNYLVIQVPLITLTLQSLASINLPHTLAKKTKNFFVLGLILWLLELPLQQVQQFIEYKFKQDEAKQANLLALQAGYNYAVTLELSPKKFTEHFYQRPAGDYRQITGVEAVSLALATIAVHTGQEMLVAGYPITPASAILHECVQLADYNLRVFQAEDEIAAIGSLLGGAFAGKLGFACTSGPGMDLKGETLGLAIMAELPLVILNVQRSGPSTGMPTKTEQSDLLQALYGRHGEAPLPVLAACSPADCFSTIIQAFNIAIKYMTPVVVLMDAYLANAAEPWLLPQPQDIRLEKIVYNRNVDPFVRDQFGARSGNLPGTPGYIYQVGGLEKQGTRGKVSYDPHNHQEMINLRANKIANIAQDCTPLLVKGQLDADILIIGWGSTAGVLEELTTRVACAWLQLQHLYPLPLDLQKILLRYKKVFMAELNNGQLWRVLRADLLDIQAITQCTGQPFTASFLQEALAC